MANENVTKRASIADFDVIIRPVITEKSVTASSEDNKYTFVVKKGANKIQIKTAIQNIYNVHVTGVNVINVPAKLLSRGTRYKGSLSAYKKAIVTIKEGETINLYAE